MGNSEEIRRIGVFGGTFDPVHKGHLAVARGVLAEYDLEELLFVPAPYPPHKNRRMTDFRHRVAMLEAVLAGEPKIFVSLIEAQRKPPSYTLDTILAMRKQMGNHHYFLLIGADSFIEVHLWYRYRDLFRYADLIVAARPGIDRQRIIRQVDNLPGPFCYRSQQDSWSRDDGFHVYYYSSVQADQSSSEIRQRLRRKQTVQDLLPPEVMHYITKHGLYGTSG